MVGYIIVFCFLLLFYLVHLIKKRKDNLLLIGLAIFYLISAVVSVFYYKSVPEGYKELNIISYIVLFISIIVAFYPLEGFYPNRYISVKLVDLSNANVIAISLILLYIPGMFFLIPSIITDFNRILLDFEYASDLYADTAELGARQTGVGLSNVYSVFRNVFAEIVVFFPFYYSLYERRNKNITVLLWLSITYPLLSSFNMGSRTMMTWWILEVIIAFVLFRKFYNPQLRKHINKVIFIVVLFVALTFALLTIGRFTTGMYEKDSYVGGSLVSYAGQGTINFADDILQNEVYQYGDNCFPLLRRMVGLESTSNLYERQIKWGSSMKIRQGNFYTFIGDLYNDFSPIIGFVMLSIFSLLLYGRIASKDGVRISSPKLFLVFFCACILYNGLFYFSYKGIGGNLKIIVNSFFIILLSILSTTKKMNA